MLCLFVPVVITFLVKAARWFHEVAKGHEGKSDFLLQILTSIGECRTRSAQLSLMAFACNCTRCTQPYHVGRVAQGRDMLPESPSRRVSYDVKGMTITTKKSSRRLSAMDAEQSAFLCLTRLFRPPVPKKRLATTLFSLLLICANSNDEVESRHIIPKMCDLMKNVAKGMSERGSLPLPVHVIIPVLSILLQFAARDSRNLRILLDSGYQHIILLLASFFAEHVHDEGLGEVTTAAQVSLVLKCFSIFYAIVWHEAPNLEKIMGTKKRLLTALVSVVRVVDSVLTDSRGGTEGNIKVTRTPTPLADSGLQLQRGNEFDDDNENDTDDDEQVDNGDANSALRENTLCMLHGIRSLAITSLHAMCKSIRSCRRHLSKERGAGDFLVETLRNINKLKGRAVNAVVANGVVFNAGSGHITSCVLDLLAMHVHMSRYSSVSC